MLQDSLSKECDAKFALPDEQFGFRKGHSADMQLYRATELIKEQMVQKKWICILFLDLQSAFDSVWPLGLIYKLIKKGFRPNSIHSIASFITQRKFLVKFGEEHSDVFEQSAGVPQGSPLSPLIYSLYSENFPKATQQEGHTFVYADDVATMMMDEDQSKLYEKMQNYIKRVEKWCAAWRIKVNPGKSSLLHIKSTKKAHEDREIKLNGTTIPWVKTKKFLGIILDESLTFRAQVEEALTRAKMLFMTLQPLIGFGSHLALSNRVLIYKALFMPTVFYAAAAWSTTSNTSLRKLDSFLHRVKRTVLRKPYFVRNTIIDDEINNGSARATIQEFLIRLMERLESHPNKKLICILDYDIKVRTVPPRPRHTLLKNS